MKILVACEESQVVTKAFRKRGHEAYSCDILPCSGGHPEWHIQGDIHYVLAPYNASRRIDLMNGDIITGFKPDMIIAHPPCIYLTNSGVCHLYIKGSGGKLNVGRWAQLRAAAEFFNFIKNYDCDKICIENPIPHKYAMEIIKTPYTQIIQPWMFGHMEQKATCLWLKGLPPLKPTNVVYDEMMKLPKNERQRLHYLSPSKDRSKLRSKTFTGIGDAMAIQWG